MKIAKTTLTAIGLLFIIEANTQQIEALADLPSDTVMKIINLDTTNFRSYGIVAEGYNGISGIARRSTGRGVLGISESGIGVDGYSHSGAGVRGASTSDRGLIGLSESDSGVFGHSNVGYGIEGYTRFSYGVYGESDQDHGAYFKGHCCGGFADIVLGGTSWFGGLDDGVIMSEPELQGSDIFLVANDAIILEIGNNPSENASFEVWNTDNADVLLHLNEQGNMTISGTLNQGSDRNRKDHITAINESKILHKLSELPISQWQYKGESIKHIGPMAKDFYMIFGIGKDDKTISSIDLGGVTIAALKALNEENKKLSNRLDEMSALLQSILKNK